LLIRDDSDNAKRAATALPPDQSHPGNAAVRRCIALAATSVILSIGPPASIAATLRVCASGCQYSTIQSAIDAAQIFDTIRVGPGTYAETLHMTLPLAKTLTLNGSGAKKTIVDAGGQNCVLVIGQGFTLAVTGMTFTNGGGNLFPGSGITNFGSLTLTNVTVSHSTGSGGAIVNEGALTTRRTTVSDNLATDIGAGGGIVNFGALLVNNSTVSGNTTQLGSGAGIDNSGQAMVVGSSIINNSASAGPGGGLENLPLPPLNATLTLIDTVVSHNTALAGGGIENQGTLTMIRSPLRNNTATIAGGGLAMNFDGSTAELTNSPVTGNSSSEGGGIYLTSGTVTLTLNRSRVSANTATTDGGGIDNASSGTVTLNKSPVRNNTPNQCINVPGC